MSPAFMWQYLSPRHWQVRFYFFLSYSISVYRLGNIEIKTCPFILFRILAVLFTVTLWVVAVATMHFAIVFKPRDILQLMIQSTGQQLTDDLEILTGRCLVFLPAVLTVIVKLASPPFARLLGRMESYPFTLRVTLYSARMFSFRIVTVLTLVTTMFHLKNNSGNKATGSNNHTDCWEDNLCLHLILIATLDFIADMLMTTVFRYVFLRTRFSECIATILILQLPF